MATELDTAIDKYVEVVQDVEDCPGCTHMLAEHGAVVGCTHMGDTHVICPCLLEIDDIFAFYERHRAIRD